tara:strand:- start:112 stop:432 length:321 start_codon:yes stop_codon:yes gene_type:complete
MEETNDIPKYNEITKGYIYKWREQNPDKYNEYHRKYYAVKKEDPEWRENHNKRCREYNRKYAEKKRGGEPAKPRGRPKKPTDFLSILEEKFMGEDIDLTDEIILLN